MAEAPKPMRTDEIPAAVRREGETDDPQPDELTTREKLLINAYHSAERSRTRWKMGVVVGGALALWAGLAHTPFFDDEKPPLQKVKSPASKMERDDQVRMSYTSHRNVMSKEVPTFTDHDLLVIRSFIEESGEYLAEILFEEVFPDERYRYRGLTGFSILPSPEGKLMTVSLEIKYGALDNLTAKFMFDLTKGDEQGMLVSNVSVKGDEVERPRAAARAASAALGKVFAVGPSEN
jgi:hypothetical protein